MPAATTHSAFAKDVFRSLPVQIQEKIKDYNLFLVGAQGPDLLFFNNFSVLPGTTCPIGSRMHSQKIPEVIRYFDTHTKEEPLLRSYLYGYLCHYAMDSRIHPLVYAMTKIQEEKTHENDMDIHFRIESEYDIYTLSKSGKTWHDYDVYNDLKLNASDTEALAVLYQGMLNEVFNISLTKKKLIRCIKDASLMTRFLKPSEKKFDVAHGLETFFHIPRRITGMMLSGRKQYTALNQGHMPWHPVFDETITYTDSYDDLYDKAKSFAMDLIQEVNYRDIDRTFNGKPM